MSDDIFSFIALQKQIHEALRHEHPEWIDPDGSSAICDSYEARFAELLHLFQVRGKQSGA